MDTTAVALAASSALLSYWPVLAVAGAGLIGWGRLNAENKSLREAVADKASRESVEALRVSVGIVRDDLVRMDGKLDEILLRK